MAEKKRKTRADGEQRNGRVMKRKRDSKSKTPGSGRKNKRGEFRKRTGPRLPSKLRKELDLLNPNPTLSDGDEGIDLDGPVDVYEYEEDLPEEESRKNRRFDPVESLEYELPEQFEDEDVPSDDDDDDDGEAWGKRENSSQLGVEAEEEDAGRHLRMLHGITGLPSEAFEGEKRKNNIVISESYPESEYNPSRDILNGDGRIGIQDLLEPLHEKAGYSKLRKRLHEVERKSVPVHAPLPKAEQEKLERKATYEQSKKEITKWEPLVKRNREAPTIYFDENIDLGFSTVGAIASEFEPRTEFEKKMASLVSDDNIVYAHKNDGVRLLELNKVSVEDVKDRQNRLAKMRSLLFRHEMKAKHIKKIKSKTYHRLMKRDRVKAVAAETYLDPETAKEHAMKQEFKRVEERMTLRHKNSSKWAKRILKRGLNAQDEGTRVAISEQLHQHALLTRKMNSMKESSSSSDDSSDDDGLEQDETSKLLEKAKEKTLKVFEEEEEVPNSGVLALPFMVRGLKKKKEAAYEEAKLALEEYESSLKRLEDTSEGEKSKVCASSGRRVFCPASNQVQEASNKIKSDKNYGNSDSEDDFKDKEIIDVQHERSYDMQKDVYIDSDLLRPETEIGQNSVSKSFDDIDSDPGPKMTYEVAIFASNSGKKIKSKSLVDAHIKKSSMVVDTPLHNEDLEEGGEDSDTDSEGQMIDGMLTSGSKPTYELPSQAELIQRAFAGDDVEEDFEKDKQEILNKENPEPEKPVLLPGWGQWTDVQQKKGLPVWMLEEHEIAKRKREEALKKRKDAHLKHVIISEKVDKKAEKLHTKTLPYPYTSKEVFEQSIRMPIGPEFNPATAVGALNRPDVVKKSGVIIKPIKFEDVNPHEISEEHGHSREKQKGKKSKSSGKAPKRTKPKENKRR